MLISGVNTVSTEIKVDKKSVEQLLSNGTTHKFVIPDYQRPYAWSEDEAGQLWEDIVDFVEGGEEETYFLGSIVYFINDNGEQEIIDGQQRITTLFLLIRALYTKLEEIGSNDDQVDQLKRMILPLIWETDRYKKIISKNNVLIYSNVMNEEGNKVFKNILKTGEAQTDDLDQYSNNYVLFQKLIDEFSVSNPMKFKDLVMALLEDVIVLPIEADSQDTALTIFNTSRIVTLS
ncbi:MAG TPA: hypothetical protein DCW31_01020 [Lactobacillus sp.]|nr:hypothetical protein [Lactobacillus sp.]